jgi:hypothetical protein
MSLVSTMYLGLSASQQRLLGDLVSQGVRVLLRDGPAIDAAMSAALSRHEATRGSMPPRVKLTLEVEVVEFLPNQQTGRPVLTVEGGGQ